MARLRDICSGLGCSNVSTYIQSGNVVLDSEVGSGELADRLEEAIEAAVGFRPRVVVRTADDLATALDRNPFPTTDDRYLHLGFMDKKPTKAAVDELGEIDCSPEGYRIIGREVYLNYVNGAGQSKKLAKVPFERRLGVAVTARNLRTVRTLVELARDLTPGRGTSALSGTKLTARRPTPDGSRDHT